MSGMAPAALVLGADTCPGLGIVLALLEVGSPVLAAAGDRAGLARLVPLQALEPGLRAGVLSLCGEAAAARLARRLRRARRPLHAVFVALRVDATPVRLLDAPASCLQAQFRRQVEPQLALARQLLPLLAGPPDPPRRYVLVAGPVPQRGWAGYGHASIAAAANRMLVQVLHEEAAPLGVRVQMFEPDRVLRERPDGARDPDAAALALGRAAVALLRPEAPAQALVAHDPRRARAPTSLLFPPPSLPLPA
ncbi:MAG: SDR family NAD(P)-dependent oxidoreductase [Pseudoxanthomonas sp.]